VVFAKDDVALQWMFRRTRVRDYEKGRFAVHNAVKLITDIRLGDDKIASVKALSYWLATPSLQYNKSSGLTRTSRSSQNSYADGSLGYNAGKLGCKNQLIRRRATLIANLKPTAIRAGSGLAVLCS
jgi:hypothetical protein